MYPGAVNPFPDAGTWRRTSEGFSAAARQPAVLSWCVPSISRSAGGNAPSRHKDGSFPSANPQNSAQKKCPLKFRQSENPCFLGCFPFRFLCRQNAAQRKETEQ